MESSPALDKKKKHDIEIVVDRIVLKGEPDSLATRLADSIEIALSLSDGLVYVQDAETNHKTVFSAKFA